MSLLIRGPYRVVLLGMAFLTVGCTELYLAFGPGGLWGPEQGGVGASTTTQPVVISAPLYVASQVDPALEMTAGAKVVVAAQLNDDNGDGVIDDNDLIDLVSGSAESQPIQIHLNNGDGTFTTFTIAGGGPIAVMTDIKIADFDGDGRNDIAVLVTDTGFTPVQGASLRGAVVLLFNPPDPTDTLAWQEVTLSGTFVLPSDDIGMTDFAVGDMNGDGLPDIVLGSNETRTDAQGVDKFIRLYPNPGPALVRSGNNWIEATNPITVDAVPFQAMALADIDGDGDLDVVASFPIAKSFNIRWLVNPLAEAGAAAVLAGSWTRRIVGQQGEVDPSNPGADFIAVGDIDGDGDPDVAAAHAGLGLVQWFRNPARPADPGGYQIVRQQTYPWEVFNLVTLRSG
ncbi:MAG TPA: VCBS repeat-containing protein, partial [Phycisphaerae bacterium]|nr:VCBS repeat-containing protein [Phycisphaerae bacterium]